MLLPDGVSYRAGDHLSIVPQNAAALVERALRRFGFAPGAHVMLAAAEGRRANLPVGEAIAVHRLLSDYVELQHPATRKQIQAMAQHTRCPFTRPKLEALLDEETLPRRGSGQAQVGARPAWRSIRRASCPSRRSSKCCR